MSKGYKVRTKNISIDPLECDIHIVITNNPNYYVDSNGLTSWVKDDPQDDISLNTDAITFSVSVSDYYILLSPFVGIDVITHECVHCIARIFYHRGEKADYANNEIFAYHVGWLAKIVWKFYKKHK